MLHKMEHDHAGHIRLVVRVLQGLTATTKFESYSALAEALKSRCARLGIRYDCGIISDAIDRLELGGRSRLIHDKQPRRRELVERPIVPDPIDKATAFRLLEELERRLGGRA